MAPTSDHGERGSARVAQRSGSDREAKAGERKRERPESHAHGRKCHGEAESSATGARFGSWMHGARSCSSESKTPCRGRFGESFFLFFPCCKRRQGAGCLWARERCVSRFCFITSKKKSMIGVKVTVAAGRLRRIWRWCEGGGFGRSSPTSQRREGAQMRRPTTTPGIANRRFSPRGRRYGQKNRVHTFEV